MLVLLLALGASAADSAPDLATRIKKGLMVRSPDRGGVRIESVHLFRWAVHMPSDELRAALVEPLQVGTVLTESHGRLRLTCHLDTCKAWLGETEIELLLEDETPNKRKNKLRDRRARARQR